MTIATHEIFDQKQKQIYDKITSLNFENVGKCEVGAKDELVSLNFEIGFGSSSRQFSTLLP